MAPKTDDFSKYITDMLSAYKMDGDAFKNAFKANAELSEKMAKVALEAAERSNELSAKWAKSTLSKMSDVTSGKAEPQDYSKAVTDFASAQAEMSAEMMSAYAEIAKKVQMETVELLMSAGKDAQEEMTAAIKTASDDMTKMATKAGVKK
jgi:hypothetical protein